ncbi:ADP-ribosylglycohydrolase family protein [Bifidobacterium choloepi]|uniref:ADP-ribosylglycohydrolase n=1 Tax=Bifidobacterium choloepi TaxID=2614131 RepID=A0A6I5NEJ4_9BIFI|nr:ADP-ribosylglycohydrolase family protein [Bifidobacterium choloepi]NEG69774.1 ADP-ribosylglycohydrolase [Bifidobacterium choloepi]
MTTHLPSADPGYRERVLRGARGALTGLALGDALGMPTQSMSAEQIDEYYGGPIHGLLDAVPEQPIAPGMKAGAVTDDTEQAFVLARRLIEGDGDLDNAQYARDLLDWEAKMKAKGSLDLLGPSTMAALHALEEGVSIEDTGKLGTTNGGAMRAAPIGIAFAPSAPDRLLARMARESCLVTHNTVQGIQATMLVAAAVSFGIEGVDDPLRHAVEYVEQSHVRAHWSAKASVLRRVRTWLRWATAGDGASVTTARFADALQYDCGTSVESSESVAAAFAIVARFGNDPTEALCFAASLGGDTDTMAAMAGAMLGAQHGPEAFDEAMRTQVTGQLLADNGLDLDATAQALGEIRLATLC